MVPPGAALVDRRTVGAALLITMTTAIGVVLLLHLIIGVLINTAEEGTTRIGISAGATSGGEDDTSVIEARSTTVAETITTETVAGRGVLTTTGGTEIAVPMATTAVVEVGAAIALGAGPDLVRPATTVVRMAENESTVVTRAATAAGANLAGEPIAAVVLRPAHLRSLSQDSRSTVLLGVRRLRLGVLLHPNLHLSNSLELESLLLPLLQWHSPRLPATTVSHQWESMDLLLRLLLLHPMDRSQGSRPQHLPLRLAFRVWIWHLWHLRPSKLCRRSGH